jgi:SAM-dependent methyltransferase
MLVPTGARLIAIEPVAGMRDELRRAVGGIEIVNGTAEAIPCPDGSADAVTAAQAFHWFATAAALREIHRVLGDGGGLGLIWNRRDLRDPLQAGLETIIQRYRSDSPAHERNDWRTAFDGNALFALEAQRQFPHRQDADPETVVDRVLSTSFIASLDEAAQASVTGDVMALIANQPALILHYLTDVFVFRRR